MDRIAMQARRLVMPLAMAIVLALAPPAHAAFTERVSVSSTGEQAALGSNESVVSTNGRYVAFVSFASNLVPGDTNGSHDVFLHDRQTDTTERMSVSSTGEEANSGSFTVAISGDGQFVGFSSSATNLVSGDTNNSEDIFLHDRLGGTTERVSLTAAGGESNGHSFGVEVSGDGRFVGFQSGASNLVAGDTNATGDAFRRDRLVGTTERVSLTNTGGEANGGSGMAGISADGRFAAFFSQATNLVAGDLNGIGDLFVRDRQNGTTERVNLSSSGVQANDEPLNATLSANGRVAAFDSSASNMVPDDTNGIIDIFVRDLDRGLTERVNVGPAGEEANGFSFSPSLNADGRLVAFGSLATNLIPGDSNDVGDVFMRDRETGATARLSVGSSGTEGDGQSFVPSLSADGRIASFTSEASNLVSGDTNGTTDVFVRDLTGPLPSTPGCSTSNRGQIIAQNGDRAVFTGGAEVSSAGEPGGNESYSDHGPVDRFVLRSVSVEAIICEQRDATITGQARANGYELIFRIDLHDGGARPPEDTYRIQLSSGYDSGEQPLRAGKVMIR
jgi:hypothetical protein